MPPPSFVGAMMPPTAAARGRGGSPLMVGLQRLWVPGLVYQHEDATDDEINYAPEQDAYLFQSQAKANGTVSPPAIAHGQLGAGLAMSGAVSPRWQNNSGAWQPAAAGGHAPITLACLFEVVTLPAGGTFANVYYHTDADGDPRIGFFIQGTGANLYSDTTTTGASGVGVLGFSGITAGTPYLMILSERSASSRVVTARNMRTGEVAVTTDTTALASSPGNTTAEMLGARLVPGNVIGPLSATWYMAATWDRGLNDDEMMALALDPFGSLLEPAPGGDMDDYDFLASSAAFRALPMFLG